MDARPGHGKETDKRAVALAMVALGVVFGDIGTSPLYALRECFHGPHALELTPSHVMGVLSLVFWSLIVVISLKYVLVVMRADNDGEGGILALMSLVAPNGGAGEIVPDGEPDDVPGEGRVPRRRLHGTIVMVGLFGAALLYGDGMITPAISVLGAVEGLEVATEVFRPYLIPITIAILVGLFLIQRHGTGNVGRLFGPVMLVWFAALAVMGVANIVQAPEVLGALSPHHAVAFFAEAGVEAFLVLGAVFLVVTGGEALYADMGHLGLRPIRLAWFAVALPGLMLNYLGQGALLLHHPEAVSNPFFRMVPPWALYPLVGLATLATIIASQAVITGAFSLTWQAVQLGYLPRLVVHHTSEEEVGQIYVPAMNWMLMFATIGLVLGFGSSSALAAAYGVAVTTTMVITSLLLALVMLHLWRWKLPLVLLVTAAFLVVDLAFFGANIIKLPHGGWFPLLVGAAGLLVMTTWRSGRRLLRARMLERGVTYEDFRVEVEQRKPTRVPGTAVYLTSSLDGIPPAPVWLLHHLNCLHERVVLLSTRTVHVPWVPHERRLTVHRRNDWLFRVEARHGFMQRPHVPRLMVLCRQERGLEDLDPKAITYVLGRETLLATERPGMALWRERFYAFLSRNAGRATAYFSIPPEQVLEIGAQIEL